MKRKIKYTAILVVIFVVLFTWGYYREANAGELRLGLGHGITNSNRWIAQDIMLSDRDWYVAVTRVGRDDNDGLPDTWRYSLGYRVDWKEQTNFSPYLRLGAAYFKDVPARLVSDHLTYDMAAGIRLWKMIDIEWQHYSTAGRTDINRGIDIGALCFAFEF